MIKKTIKKHFFKYPNDKLRVREIERKLNLPLPSIIRYCKELKDEKILEIYQLNNSKFYTANKTSEEYLLEKKLHNIKTIYTSKLINYLKRQLSNPVIILFGSFSKGEDMEDSDIDLYIETRSKKKINITEFEKIFGKNIEIFRFESINDIKNVYLKNNIVNGIVLNSQLEVFKNERSKLE